MGSRCSDLLNSVTANMHCLIYCMQMQYMRQKQSLCNSNWYEHIYFNETWIVLGKISCNFFK